ncbi:SRPBCC domain-containing protein [Altererythrobacter sp. ZODW24]|uniref:SRPBCC family protein n=1 Tax=Altererythrobacter sp. ZODW24 TaxID=2185142 RepID=UPI000DF81A7D|nr:SRPBCC domain-containing protein [Altererythrobacter sp. ZODW24]
MSINVKGLRNKPRNLVSALAASMLVTASPAFADERDVEMEVIEEGDQKTLIQSVLIAAPVADVWAAFTTEDGYTSWAVPNVRIDLRTGGMMESNYSADFVEGDPQNIKNQIIAYVPERLLVLKNVQAPAGFASRETMDRLTSVFEFEAMSDGSTKVTIHGIGYGSDEESLKLIEFFKIGNQWSFEQLQKLFANEGTVPD